MKLIKASLALLLYTLFYCSSAVAQCTKDVECKGSRVCEKGMCVAPNGGTLLQKVDTPKVLAPQEIDAKYTDPEVGIAYAIQLNKSDSTRMGKSGLAIQAYMRDEIVDRKPISRIDYTDYYVTKKPMKFMGHDLIVIEEEYPSQWIGCCASPGLGLTVKLNGSPKSFMDFAKQNGCTFDANVNLPSLLATLGSKQRIAPGEYAAISCRDRDIGIPTKAGR
jgi:hypothetical protein